MNGPVSLIRIGLITLAGLLRDRDFWRAYLLWFGIFDIASAIYSTTYPDNLSGQLWLSSVIGGNLSIIFTSLALLIIARHKSMRPSEAWKKTWQAWKTNFIAGLYISLGFLCFVVPGIILLIRYLYINQTVIFEDCAIHPALRRSHRLSKVNGGKLFGALSLLFVGYIVLSTISQLILVTLYEPASTSFAFNFLIQIFGTALTALMITTTYAGYLDAVANIAEERLL